MPAVPEPDERPGAPHVRVVLSTAPPGKAQEIAARLVEERHAACVNLIPGVRSVYRWKGAVHDDPETVLVIKTVAARVDGLIRRLIEVHPYETPEALVLAPEGGAPSYLDWVRAETESGPLEA
jgi:periplasmic divalent cation tolerance protein